MIKRHATKHQYRRQKSDNNEYKKIKFPHHLFQLLEYCTSIVAYIRNNTLTTTLSTPPTRTNLPIWQNSESMTNLRRRYDAAVARPPYIGVSDEALDEFIAIYKDEFGEDVSRAEASEMASNLLMFYGLLARKLPSEQEVSPSTTQHDASDEDEHPRA
jgi:hypothetical protein